MHLIMTGERAPAGLLASISSVESFGDAFEVGRPLSYTDDCVVTTARCKATGQQVVLKNYAKHSLQPLALLQVRTEFGIQHSLCGGAHVAPMLCAFEDARYYCLVLEYANGGDLRAHMKRGHPMEEHRVRDFIATPVVRALAQLQHEGIVHRDVKPENVLVHGGQVMLADFGMAMYFSTPPPCIEESRQDPAAARALACLKLANNAGGTVLYSAPEMLKAMFSGQPMQPAVHHKNDVWALGLMLIEALTGQHPFSPENCTSYSGNVMYAIAHCKGIELPRKCSAELRDFLSLALQRDPALRPTAGELLHHPWLSAPVCSSPSLLDLPSSDGTGVKGLPRNPSAAGVNCCAGTDSGLTCDDSDDTAFQDAYQDGLEEEPSYSEASAAIVRNTSEDPLRTEGHRTAFEDLLIWAD
ncbi:hypothetical protein FOA52_011553 [Chlamydomonas sp. UWO 241]|nr:hypothetical protein FOA52_011553 [Chlamydomonas sp. UWO 241]